MSLPERQQELVETHRAVQSAGLPYVLVGGWAISAFQTRFTTDVDVVVPETVLEEYDDLLRDRGYEKQFDSDVSNVYEGRIVRYEKAVGDHAVEFDAMVGAMRCRQTDAEWSYRYLHEHSVVESLDVAPEYTARIPEPALLFALKLHSGRIADTRDLVILSTEASFDRIERHLHRGDPDSLAQQIGTVLTRFESPDFEDSFKGVFRQQEMPTDTVERLRSFLAAQRDEQL